MANPIVFRLTPSQITSKWLADNAGANEELAGIVFWFNKDGLEPDAVEVQQMYRATNGTVRFHAIGNSGKLKSYANVFEITQSASTGQSSAISAYVNPATTPKLYHQLEFYVPSGSADNPDSPAVLDFVYFDKQPLETICDTFNEVYISGAEVRLGALVEIPVGGAYQETNKYFSMKVEGKGYTGQGTPGQGFALGVVCPPKWYTNTATPDSGNP